jgi:hypothetical protein
MSADRLRMVFRDDRARLLASSTRRDADQVLADLDTMLRYAHGRTLIIVTDPRAVLVDDPDGLKLAAEIMTMCGSRGLGVLHPWVVDGKRPVPPSRVRWSISVGRGLGMWLRGRPFAGHPFPGNKITSWERLFRWLPSGLIADPCAGYGDLIVPAQRAGREILAVTDRPGSQVAAKLGQGELFSPYDPEPVGAEG